MGDAKACQSFPHPHLAVTACDRPWSIAIIANLRIWLLPKIPTYEFLDAAEMGMIANALEDYAATYGEYPPDFTSGNPRKEIDDHLRKIFPGRDSEADLPLNIHQLGPRQCARLLAERLLHRQFEVSVDGQGLPWPTSNNEAFCSTDKKAE